MLREFGGRLSFNGTIGTQTTMPFGTPEEVKATVRRNLELAGPRGGLLCCPTHMLEPEVPWENIEAYVEALPGVVDGGRPRSTRAGAEAAVRVDQDERGTPARARLQGRRHSERAKYVGTEIA